MKDKKIRNSSFIPAQPDLEFKTEDYQEHLPIHRYSSENIAYFYQFKTKKEPFDSFSVIPDGCFDIIFECSPGNPKVFLWTSPEKRKLQIDMEADCYHFGIRFFPEQNAIKLENSMKELLNKKIPLQDVMKFNPIIIEQLCSESSFTDKIQCFETFLFEIQPEINYQKILSYCTSRIYQGKGQFSVQEIVKETGYSDRYLRKIFDELLGFSPKKFSEIVRFQNTLHVICKEEHYDLQDIVTDNGYHDLPHMLKGFKKFVDLTPHKFKEYITS